MTSTPNHSRNEVANLAEGSVPPSDSHQATDVEWMGSIPAGWNTAKLRWLFDIGSGDALYDEPAGQQYPLVGGNGVRGRVDRKNTEGPVVIVGRVGAQCGNVHYFDSPIWATEHALKLIPQPAIQGKYAAYALRAAHLRRLGGGTAQPVIAASKLADELIPFPPYQLQSHIVAFLDRKTGEIENLIAKKERLIELLEEKRTALITQAVTKGLDPDVPMKDSGVEWLGEIPEHWDLARLSRAVDGCFNGIWGDKPDGEHDVACLRVEDFDRFQATVRTEEPTTRSVEPRYRSQRQLEVGDLLLEKSGGGKKQPVGFVVLVNQLDCTSVCSNFAARMPVRNGVSPSFLRYVFYHLYHTGVNIRSIKQTTGIQNLDASHYLSTPFALPSISVQHEIARYLEDQTESIRRLILRIQEAIDRLHEYRSALITAVVTGKIDVRDHAA